MPAAIGKGAQRPLAIAQHDGRPADRLDGAIVAGRGEFLDTADEEPVAAVYVLDLGTEERILGVAASRQAARREQEVRRVRPLHVGSSERKSSYFPLAARGMSSQ